MNDTSIPRPALVLGWLGVLPFAAFSLAAATGAIPLPVNSANALVLYGAVILSFMGGAQWGLAMAHPRAPQPELWSRLSISVLPALAGFGLWFAPGRQALLGLAAAFICLLAYDAATARRGDAPAWYPALRLQLTAAVIVCLLVPAIIGFR